MASVRIPFSRDNQLCNSLEVSQNPFSIKRQSIGKNTLPGQPRIDLNSSDMTEYLSKELMTPKLDQLAPHMWLLATPDSGHVYSLTRQVVKGRSIVVTEDPSLHLVWFYDRIYLKPLPKYLLSYAFWEFYLAGNNSSVPIETRQALAKAAQGFIRTYGNLIRHKSDFLIAKSENDAKNRLIPKHVSYLQFTRFISAFEHLLNDTVSPRYAFGQLRLTRLNFWSKIYLHQLTFEKIYIQYGAYFARFYGPIGFIFAVFSVSLSAMQVVLAVQPLDQSSPSWQLFAYVSRGFSIGSLVSVAIITMLLMTALLVLIFREAIFATRVQWKKRRGQSLIKC
ncbi:MAG: hypothetical protein M1834_009490 [Cirrosporium novae-zelandiae]|nr:MAG: hypothetical protein M1834_009490 [Cirrosporium novae-zelandiae]